MLVGNERTAIRPGHSASEEAKHCGSRFNDVCEFSLQMKNKSLSVVKGKMLCAVAIVGNR